MGAARALRRWGPAPRRQDRERVHHPPCPAPPAARSSDRRAGGARGPNVRVGLPGSASWPRGSGASLGVTPRQACPRPDGLGRNLRSKTRWFAGFCNSHQVSHFATFFIDARAEISVAESRTVQGCRRGRRPPRPRPRDGSGRRRRRPASVLLFLGALRAGFGPPAAPSRTPRAHLRRALAGGGVRAPGGRDRGREGEVDVAGRSGLPAPMRRSHVRGSSSYGSRQ
jgi:hypothetical protein